MTHEIREREAGGARGWALVDAVTGEPVLLVDDGYGSPDVAGGLLGPVADRLARAPQLEAQVRRGTHQNLEHTLLPNSPTAERS